MSARTTLNKLHPYSGSASSGPIDFAGNGFNDTANSGMTARRAGLLLRIALVATVLLAAATSFAAVSSSTPSAHVSSAQYLTQVATATSLESSGGVAVDAVGDVFIIDTGNYRVLEEQPVTAGFTATARYGLPTQSNQVIVDPLTESDQLDAIAVDSKGTLYVAQYSRITGTSSGYQVDKYAPQSAGPEAEILLNGVSAPHGVVVDSAGNVYVACISQAEGNTGDGLIVKLTPQGTSHNRYTQSTIVDAPGLSPWGLAMDTSGDFYIADTTHNKVWKATPLTTGNYGLKTIGSGFESPQGIAVYGTTVYVANYGAQITALDPEKNGDYISRVIDFGGSNPTGLATDSSGNLFISNDNPGTVVEIEQSSSPLNFGMVNAGQISQMATLTFTFDTGGAVMAPEILTDGNPGGSFGIGSISNVRKKTSQADEGSSQDIALGIPACQAQTYEASDSCSVSVVFAPSVSGNQQGAVVLAGANGLPIATAYLTGTAVGALASLLPPSQTVWVSDADVSDLNGEIAVDAQGDCFFSNASTNTVWMEGGPLGTVSIGSGLKNPKGVALDAAGNLYISDYGNDRILRETPVAGSSPLSYLQSVVYAPSEQLSGLVAVDQNGNVFAFTFSGTRLYEAVPQPDGSYQTAAATMKGLNGAGTTLGAPPEAMTADAGGNLYVIAGEPWKLTRAPGTTNTYVVTSLPASLVQGIAVDANGDVYLTQYGGAVVRLGPDPHFVPGQVNYKESSVFPPRAFGNPVAIAIDSQGSVFVADAGIKQKNISPQIVRNDFFYGPIINFPDTQIDSDLTLINAPSTQTVTITNLGNEPMMLPIPESGTNPGITSGFTFDSSTTCPEVTPSSSEEGTLQPQEFCSMVVDFDPGAVGSVTGSASFTYTGTTGNSEEQQSITFAGNGVLDVPEINWPTPAAIVYGTALGSTQLNATAMWNGNPVPGSFTYGVGPNYSPSGPAALGAVLPAGSQTLYGSFQPANTAQFNTVLASVTIQVDPAVLTVVADSWSRTYGSPNPAQFTASYVGFVNGDSAATALTGAPQLTTEATQQYPWGYYPIVAAQGTLAAANYTFQFVDGTLVITQAPLTVTADNETVANSSDIPNPYPCTITGFVNGDTAAVVSGACGTNAQSYSSSPAGTYTVTPTVGTLSAVNYTFDNFASGTLTISGSQSMVTIGSGFSQPEGVAVDASGNVYVTDAAYSYIAKETLANNAFTQSDVGSTDYNQFGVAVDGSGNLYVTASGANEVWELAYANGSYTQTVIETSDTGSNNPRGIAVDKNGNVFVANLSGNDVIELSPDGSGEFSRSFIASASGQGLNSPEGLAVDSNGNVYIADTGNNRVVIMNNSAGSFSMSSTVFSGFSQVDGVAVDTNGNVYISSAGNSTIYKETLSNGTYTQSVFLSTGLSAPGGVAVDANGNVYITDTGDSRVVEVTAAAAVNSGQAARGSAGNQPPALRPTSTTTQVREPAP